MLQEAPATQAFSFSVDSTIAVQSMSPRRAEPAHTVLRGL
jgi:hypothetical protein